MNVSAAQFGSAFGEVGEVAAGARGVGGVPQNLLYFTITGSSVYADCATAPAPRYVIDKDESGDTMTALLLAAKMSGKKVHVAGRGTCNKISGHEDVSLIYID